MHWLSNARFRLALVTAACAVPAALSAVFLCRETTLSLPALAAAAAAAGLAWAAAGGVLLAAWHQRGFTRLAGLVEALARGEARESELARYRGLAGRLADAVAALGRRHRDLLRTQQSLVTELSAISAEMSDSAERIERNVFEQQRDTDQVATAMNEMSTTVSEVARLTGEAAEAARQAQEAAGHGMAIAAGTRDEIQQLVKDLEQAAEVIHRLEEESGNIGAVLDVIKNIAEQTNLLALNAAIEAARAGEQGRGFAVVADEVRTLASRTHSSTQEIEQMISRVQEGVAGSVAVINAASQRGSTGSEKMRETVAALESIQQAVDAITGMNTQIATAAEEQSQVAEDINRNVVHISELAATSTDDARTGREIAMRLAGNAERIQATLSDHRGGLDLSAAKAAHLNWKTRLRAFLDGQESITEAEAVSHRHCKFGKWYYSEGLQQYGHLPAMREVEKPHEELHELIRVILDLKKNGRVQEAEEAYRQVAEISSRIVALLDEAERQAG